MNDIVRALEEAVAGTEPFNELPTKHTIAECKERLRERLSMARTGAQIANALLAFAHCSATAQKTPSETETNPYK